MYEYLTDAVVLARTPQGEADVRVALFTKEFGMLSPRAKSARKITSKLSGHLQPGNIIRARVIEKKGLQIVDALKKGSVEVALPDLSLLSRMLAEGEAEERIWEILFRGPFEWRALLVILGWAPGGGQCAKCGERDPKAFYLREQSFFCKKCALKLPADEVVYI